MSVQPTEYLRFTSQKALTHRLVLSTLTGRPVHISQIRSSSAVSPGLASHEISFIRLLEAITNGSSLQISYTGLGAHGDVIEYSLPATNTRGVSYFLLPLCMLAPFSKAPINVRFTGPGVITSSTEAGDISVDSVRTGDSPAIRTVRLPKTLHLNRNPGRIKRIRGVSYCTGVSASNNARMIHAARGVLNPLVSDVHIAAQYDQAPLVSSNDKADPKGKKRTGIGFGLSLVAESSSGGVLYSADVAAPPQGGVTPEDIGKQAALQLLETIAQGGCVAKAGAATILTLMSMGSEDVGRLRIGRDVIGTEDILGLGRDLRKFGASAWGLRDVDEDESGDILVSVKGVGIGNVGRKIA
ncbi:hypothetical protein VC83_07912 [Pseudogymnoascus destructans]|uniref:18S rRNA biogenesis protein RCL1 n=1 Tax=Pseudogymnoascus destructans TaxID=655981 RepID=A0A177A1F9_9PEZI|nr:uncharacterized protein VC83_07912 [Pseudogymnoascus destructans]OAF55988.1 hypothetical protein VC83_07912 [Pseudogymnoascus destructans]